MGSRTWRSERSGLKMLSFHPSAATSPSSWLPNCIWSLFGPVTPFGHVACAILYKYNNIWNTGANKSKHFPAVAIQERSFLHPGPLLPATVLYILWPCPGAGPAHRSSPQYGQAMQVSIADSCDKLPWSKLAQGLTRKPAAIAPREPALLLLLHQVTGPSEFSPPSSIHRHAKSL